MSYQVLARKWRPKTFESLMGQEHVVTVLVNALTQQRLHHAYLFTGTRGIGKTTIARIFAKSLNCQQGVTATPCGKCDACVDIDQGRFVDLLEIDAASRTKVDDTREILDNVQYAPSRGRYKVYLIDEVHMLSRSSFNALLKTLEEPPEHVKFILATTDPQKLPVTVLSRCLQFHLKALTVGQIEQKLNEILAQESVAHEPSSLTLLAKAARGSMRDALSLTDQSIAQGQGQITIANVQQMLGGVDQNWVYKILMALIKQNAEELMSLSLEIAAYAPSYSRLTAELIQLLHQIAMAQVVGNHFDLQPNHSQLLDKFCLALSPEDVQLYYQIVLTGRKDLPYAADEQAAFDMVLLRLLAFKPMQTNENQIIELKQHKEDKITFDDVTLAETEVSNQAQNQSVLASKPDADFVEDPTDNISDSVVTEAQLAEEMHAIELTAQEQGMAVANDISDNLHQAEPDQANNSSVAADPQPTAEPDLFSNTESAQATESVDDSEQGSQVQIESMLATTNSSSQHSNLQVENNKTAELTPNNTDQLNSTTVSKPTPDYSSPVEAAIATRNMLRSRKKQLEAKAKKSNDAAMRQDEETTNTGSPDKDFEQKPEPKPVKNNAPAIETVPEQPYTNEVIDPTSVRFANQVDKWANMIDTMALSGRIRQLAIHATISDLSTDDTLVLDLDQTTKHLKTDVAHQQLQSEISDYLQRPIEVQLNIVEQTIADPYQIQTDINDKRLEYAISLIKSDEVVNTFEQKYQAQLDENSIVAR